MYDVDFDHQFIETRSMMQSLHTRSSLVIALAWRLLTTIVGIENSDGNTNVRFHQKDTLKRFFERFEAERTYNQSFQELIVDHVQIVEEIETQQILLYPRKPLQFALHHCFALRGWKTEINGIEFELNSILVEVEG